MHLPVALSGGKNQLDLILVSPHLMHHWFALLIEWRQILFDKSPAP